MQNVLVTCCPLLQALVYARAAAAVQACQFKIGADLRPGQIPYVGTATASKIREIVLSPVNECTVLRQMR